MSKFPNAGRELDRLRRVEPIVYCRDTTNGRIVWRLWILGLSTQITASRAEALIAGGVRHAPSREFLEDELRARRANRRGTDKVGEG